MSNFPFLLQAAVSYMSVSYWRGLAVSKVPSYKPSVLYMVSQWNCTNPQFLPQLYMHMTNRNTVALAFMYDQRTKFQLQTSYSDDAICIFCCRKATISPSKPRSRLRKLNKDHSNKKFNLPFPNSLFSTISP